MDTNIYLDFYRVRGRDAGLTVLSQLASNIDRLIVTSQVEMEFMKNRQAVIVDSYKLARPPEWSSSSVPSFLLDSKPNKAFESAKKQVGAQMDRLRKRIAKVLTEPSRYDKVYSVARGIFRSSSPHCLGRTHDARDSIRRLALKRFGLGYPPRKDSDTSIGDAVNWEWIIRCAVESQKHIVIVSRDSDYGKSFQGTSVLNDWLRHEFSERVSKRRKIVLTDRLTDAFKRLSIPVTPKEEEQEEELVQRAHAETPSTSALSSLAKILSSEELAVVTLALGLHDQKVRSANEVAASLSISTKDVVELMGNAIAKMRAQSKEQSAAT